MKKKNGFVSMVGLGTSLLVVSSVAAQGAEKGPFLNFDAGVALAEDVDLKKFIVPVSGVKVEFDPGARFSVGGGYNFNEYIGLGVETGFIYNSVDKLKGSGGSLSDIDSSLSHVPMMANVTLRYDKPDVKWLPYAGFGAGGDISILNISEFAGSNVDETDSDVVFAWQAFAGLRYKITPQISLGGGYKYYWADDAELNISGADIKQGSAGIHSFVLSFNFSF